MTKSDESRGTQGVGKPKGKFTLTISPFHKGSPVRFAPYKAPHFPTNKTLLLVMVYHGGVC